MEIINLTSLAIDRKKGVVIENFPYFITKDS